MEPSGLFDAPAGPPPASADAPALEQRLDRLAEAAKEAGQSAGKLRTLLGRIEEDAKAGAVGTLQTRISHLSESLAQLSSLADVVVERSVAFQSDGLSEADYIRELGPELQKRGVEVTKGPAPFWLAYPASFQIERDSKGSLRVILNGDRVDSIRPAVVAAKIAEVVNEKFNAKQFRELLFSVREVFRRAGADGNTLSLEDVYAVLSMGSGRRSSGGGDLSKSAFYYSVHRLAEGIDAAPGPVLNFPPANRPDLIFFTKDGGDRKYLRVDFPGGS